jgi:hypothetical protein
MDDYGARLNMFTATPLIASALHDVMNKFAQGQLVVYGCDDLPLRTNEDAQLTEALRHSLIDGSRYALLRPDLTLRWLGPEHVIKQTAEGAKLRWDMTADELNEETKDIIRTWVLVYDDRYETYQATVRLNHKGTITVCNGVSRNVQDVVLEPQVTEHSFGRVPLFCLNNRSIVDFVMAKQEEFIRVENNRQMAGYTSGYVQRVVKPLGNVEDIAMAANSGYAQSSNETIMMAERFEFVESPGNAIANQTLLLEDIRETIKHLVNLSGLTWSKPVQASGASKQFEVMGLDASLTALGRSLTEFWQEVLRTAAQDELVDVSGYDDFSFDTIDSLLDILAKAKTLADDLAPTALTQLRLKTSKALAEGCSLSISNTIEAEIAGSN